MYEVDKLCENIGIMNHGNLVAFDTPQALKDDLLKASEEALLNQGSVSTTVEEETAKDLEKEKPAEVIPKSNIKTQRNFDNYKITTELSIMMENLSDAIVEKIKELPYVYNIKLSGNERITAEINKFSHEEAINEIIAIVLENNALITSISTNDPSLEEFL
jgi:ABC-2 type transport system ATP-binding protein